jgi:hypothetical protein
MEKNKNNSNYYILHLNYSINGVCIETQKTKYINNKYITDVIDNNTLSQNKPVYSEPVNNNICTITTKQNTIDGLTKELNKVMNDINKSDITESICDVYEEIKIDNSINDIKNNLDDMLDYELLDNISSAENISDDDSIDITLNEEDGRQLQKLIKDRNELQYNIKNQEKLINVANNILNEELFQQRCIEQEQKRRVEKHEELLSIFRSDKNTYLHISSKIKSKILNCNNIPALFKQKYIVIHFLDINNLIYFLDNDDIDIEYGFYEQLSKIVEYYDNIEETTNIFDKLDNEFMQLYESFMDYLANNEELILSEKRFNNMLNNDTMLKEQLFGKKTENDIFKNDIDKHIFAATN